MSSIGISHINGAKQWLNFHPHLPANSRMKQCEVVLAGTPRFPLPDSVSSYQQNSVVSWTSPFAEQLWSCTSTLIFPFSSHGNSPHTPAVSVRPNRELNIPHPDNLQLKQITACKKEDLIGFRTSQHNAPNFQDKTEFHLPYQEPVNSQLEWKKDNPRTPTLCWQRCWNYLTKCFKAVLIKRLQQATVNILESSEKLQSFSKEMQDVKKNQIGILELKTNNNWNFKTH